MRRREFIAGAGAAAAWPAIARAQQPAGLPHIGILDPNSAGGYADTRFWSAFRDEMARRGHIDGKTIVFDYRWAGNQGGRLAGLATELLGLRARVIVATSTPAIIAARSVTSEVPIIGVLMADPVGSGFAQSLARPGGNITGLSTLSAELSAKRLELLSEIVPSLSRAGMVWDQNNPSFALTVRHTEAAARSLGMALEVHGVHRIEELRAALSELERANSQALVAALPAGSARFGGDAGLVAAIAEHRLPAAYSDLDFVHNGGLVSYGPNYVNLFRRAALYADKILKGARPAELPIEEPNVFVLGVNLKTAKELGVAVPRSVLIRADEVVE